MFWKLHDENSIMSISIISLIKQIEHFIVIFNEWLFCLPGTTEQDGDSTAAAKTKTCNKEQQPQQVCYVQLNNRRAMY